MDRETINRLCQNPNLNLTTLPRALYIFDCASRWSYKESFYASDNQAILVKATIFPGTVNDNRPKFLDLVDQDVFSKIQVDWTPYPLSIRKIIDDAELFEKFLQIAKTEPSNTAPYSSSLFVERLTVPTPTLQLCKIVEFRIKSSAAWRKALEGKTFGGVLFKWQTMGPRDLLGQEWAASEQSYRCPRHLLDRFVKALGRAIAELHETFDDLDKYNDHAEATLSFGPLFQIISEKQGFVGADQKLYYPNEVPWEELAEKGLTIHK